MFGMRGRPISVAYNKFVFGVINLLRCYRVSETVILRNYVLKKFVVYDKYWIGGNRFRKLDCCVYCLSWKSPSKFTQIYVSAYYFRPCCNPIYSNWCISRKRRKLFDFYCKLAWGTTYCFYLNGQIMVSWRGSRKTRPICKHFRNKLFLPFKSNNFLYPISIRVCLYFRAL